MTYTAIRQQIHLIPELVKSALLSQALDVEQVITATFVPSDGFRKAVASLAPEESNRALAAFSDLSFKAYEAGARYAKTKPKTIDIPASFAGELESRFRNLSLSLTPGQTTDACVKLSDAIAIAFREGAQEGGAKPAKVVKASVDPALEAYTKLLGTAEAEKVLRYYLGLGEKTPAATPVVAAKKDKEEKTIDTENPVSFPAFFQEEKKEKDDKEKKDDKKDESDKIGPFYVNPLREAIVEYCKDFSEKLENNDGVYRSITDGDLEFLIIDELVPGCDKLSDDALLRAMCQVLELADCDDIAKIFEYGDEIAEKLTKKLDLDGSLLLMTLDDCYSLVFSFKPKDLKKLCKVEASAKDDKNLMSPMGALSVKVQDEIKALAKLPTNFLYKDIKKASTKVAVSYYSSLLTDFRNSLVGLRDATKLLNAGIQNAISAVYGQDAADYYDLITAK